MRPPLPVGCGTSTAAGSAAAGTAAAEAALADLAGAEPALLLVFASVAHDLPVLVAAVRAAAGDVPLAGATTSGSYLDGEPMASGPGVTVLALGAGAYRFGTAAVTGLGAHAQDAGARLVTAARAAAGPDAGPHAAVILLADGLNADQQGLLTGVFRVAGAAVPVVGGAAADDRRLERTFVLHGDEVLPDGAVAIWIGGDEPFRVVSEHGWQARSLPMVVTRADGTAVHELGGRPAAAVFLDHAGPRSAAAGGSEVPEDWYSGHAFGLIEPDGSHLVRGCYIDPAGCLHTFAPLPPYAAVEVVSCRADDLLDVADRVAARALDGGDASLLLCFSCVARVDVVGQERAAEEPRRLAAAAPGVRTFGWYTYGEFARTAGVAGFHNATLAALAL